jgi:uncharacterized damage-inducible protein DinB
MMITPTAADPKITTCNPVPGYTPQIGRYVAQLIEVRSDLKQEIAGLSIEQIDWHPNDTVESIGTLLLHVASVEWSWLHEDMLGRPSEEYPGDWAEAMPIRVGVAQISGRPVEWYIQHLDSIREGTLAILRGLTGADLAKLVGEAEPPPGEEKRSRLFTIDWIIWHIIEHEATHVGQVEMLRRLGPQP